MKLEIHTLLALAALASARHDQASLNKNLAFNNDGTFQISIIEDLHYGEGKFGRDNQFSSQRLASSRLTNLT